MRVAGIAATVIAIVIIVLAGLNMGSARSDAEPTVRKETEIRAEMSR